MNIPVWLGRQWEQCVSAHQAGRFPHALLLSGPPGLGKLALATALSQLLLCQSSVTEACGQCASCHWFQKDSHPDFILVTPEEDKKQISIASIRELTESLGKTAHGSKQVVIIHPAEALNRAGANALLKTLEEPSGSVVMILVSDHPAGLLATIRSRCQQMQCQPPTQDQALAWLENQLASSSAPAGSPNAKQLLALADGLPYQAWNLAQSGQWQAQDHICTQFLATLLGQRSVIETAQEWAKHSAAQVLGVIATLLLDMVRLHAGATAQYAHHSAALAKVLAVQSVQQLWSLWQDVMMARRRALSTANPNIVLLFESLLLPYVNINGRG